MTLSTTEENELLLSQYDTPYTVSPGVADPSEAEAKLVIDEVQHKTKKWDMVFFAALVAIHAGAIASLFFLSWSGLVVFLVLWVLAQNVGIGVCYHRLLTHRGFVVPKWVEYLFAFFATLGFEGSPIYWVAVHRLHHQLTDKPGDPHSPREGTWWSHIGWMLYGALHNESPVLKKYAPDLAKQRYYRILSKFHWAPVIVLAGVLFYFGGWSWLLMGTFLRICLGWHATWLVNSATHLWGSRRFNTRDDSRNLWWVALISGGEGWHNNHHAHPASVRHGMAWYEFDFNFVFIRTLGLLGIAKKLRITSV